MGARTGVVGAGHVVGRVVLGEQPLEQRAGHPAERPARALPVEHRDLEVRAPSVRGSPPAGSAPSARTASPSTSDSRSPGRQASTMAAATVSDEPPITTKPVSSLTEPS